MFAEKGGIGAKIQRWFGNIFLGGGGQISNIIYFKATLFFPANPEIFGLMFRKNCAEIPFKKI